MLQIDRYEKIKLWKNTKNDHIMDPKMLRDVN